jgi:hypothetical protein
MAEFVYKSMLVIKSNKIFKYKCVSFLMAEFVYKSMLVIKSNKIFKYKCVSFL